MATAAMPVLERRLRREVEGDVLFDRFSRGRYATDASFYQMMPRGVVVPATMDAAKAAIRLAREEGMTVLPRGGGTSQCGQTVNESLVVDCSRRLNRILDLDVAGRTCRVEPGIVLDDLNAQLKRHGLWFPVDVSTASRATIGGMTANNSCGGRSLRYGTMRDNVMAIEAMLADGTEARFGEIRRDLAGHDGPDRVKRLIRSMLSLGEREAQEIAARFPKVQRRVGGYNIDALTPRNALNNLAHLLVGSEGTLAFTTAVELKLWPLIGRRAVGVCHFGSFHAAMEAPQHLVGLKPIAIELVDRTMIGLGRDIPLFRPTIEAVVKGDPDALLLVEFAEESEAENATKLAALTEMMGDLGHGWDRSGAHWGGVVEVTDARLQGAITEFRQAGLNVMMSMKDERKPVSFVEDCAVPLPHLADYTARLTEVFARHGTTGTWYAHASEGCLHVRPVLNLKLEKDVTAMRAIAEEAFALVKAYKGSHSGEHGDGIVRSEWHLPMYGERIVSAFREVKQAFDPAGLFNPGKITDAPAMDDREKFRYPPGYVVGERTTALDWSEYPGAMGGFQGAVEMCNNNGACRKSAGAVMCPSYRVTRAEKDVTRGRANTLRLAISGQLGPGALTSDDMAETMALCVSCKACRRECPTGVDMARMKIEVLAARTKEKGLSLRDRLIAFLPAYAPFAARLPWLFNLRDRIPGLAGLSETLLGLSARRSLPRWRRDFFDLSETAVGPGTAGEVILFADTFNRYQEPENLHAAIRVLTSAGYRVHLPEAADRSPRPLCCGRTYLAVGLVDRARAELERTWAAIGPLIARGVPLIGLEPSCLYSFRDEATAILPKETAAKLAGATLLFEEFLMREHGAGRLKLDFEPMERPALLHGHCHQKSFGGMGAVEACLKLVPGLAVTTVESSCCGMAGAFGYQAETIDISIAMAEQSILPAVRAAPADAIIVADGTSCRHQIADGTTRAAVHVARVLEAALAKGS